MANMKFSNKKRIDDENIPKWKILISDDEEDIHLLTKTVLKNFKYKKLSWLDFTGYY